MATGGAAALSEYGVESDMRSRQLIIPVENQVRELEAKLLLACAAALRGHSAVIGWKGHIDQRIAWFPRGIYFLKSMTKQNLRMVRILRRLGHKIIAWDEEAVVHYPPEVYFGRRLCAEALGYIDHLVAWGPDNEKLFRAFPSYPGTPIHVLGNPRGDLQRKELRGLFEEEARGIKERYGDFILANTNFGSINAFVPGYNVCVADPDARNGLTLGRGARGMPEDYARGLFQHRSGILGSFKQLLPRLAVANPDRTIILRPHPSEDHGLWRSIAAPHENIQVVAEGNVLPWLLACRALIHNGCTTGVEAFSLDVPAFSYELQVSEDYDNHLPNALSRRCSSFEELQAGIDGVFAGHVNRCDNLAAQQALLAEFVCALEGPFACERLVDLVDRVQRDFGEAAESSSVRRLAAMGEATWRQADKVLRGRLGSKRYGTAFMRQLYPKRSLEEMRELIARCEGVLERKADGASVGIEQVSSDVFRVFGVRARHS